MKLLLMLAALFCCTLTFGQDLLYTKNKGVLEVKVTEISDQFIKYRLFHMPEGVLYTTTKRQVDSVVFYNGMVERFTPESREKHRRISEEQVKNALTTQLSAGFHTFGSDVNTMFDGEQLSNPFAAAAFIKYKKEILRKRVGLYAAPFIAFNKEAYGTAAGAQFNIKRFGKFTIGVGPEYIFSVQDIVEEFYSNNPGENDFSFYYKRYRSAVSMVTFNTNMNLHLNPRLSFTGDVAVGGIVGSSKRKENMLFSKHSYYNGATGSFRIGLGYWF